jgi:prepilin-type processing-associated H-X9-DG protein
LQPYIRFDTFRGVMKNNSSNSSSTAIEILFPTAEPRRSYDEIGYVADPHFVGLLRGVMYASNKRFKCGKRAYQIEFFGRLNLPEGVSVLTETLLFEESVGGNNNCRVAYLPAGTEVYYCPTKGGIANMLWADGRPSLNAG